jgi:hypothetical protein
MEYARQLHKCGFPRLPEMIRPRKCIARDLPISDESERLIADAVRTEKLLEVAEPYDLGEVSFHLGLTLHRAGLNSLPTPRRVHTVPLDPGRRDYG